MKKLAVWVALISFVVLAASIYPESLEQRLREWGTLVAGAISIYIVRQSKDPDAEKWAGGTIGLWLGYWLRGCP